MQNERPIRKCGEKPRTVDQTPVSRSGDLRFCCQKSCCARRVSIFLRTSPTHRICNSASQSANRPNRKANPQTRLANQIRPDYIENFAHLSCRVLCGWLNVTQSPMVCDESPSTLQRFASLIVHCSEHPVQVLAVLDAQALRHLLREGMLAVGCGHMRGRIAKVQKRSQFKTGVRPQRVEGPRSIGELGTFALHRVKVGRREVILVIHEPHMVERLGRIAAVFDGEVK